MNLVTERAGHVAKIEEGRGALKILTGKLKGKRPLGRFRHQWEDNIRMNLKEMAVNMSNLIDSLEWILKK